jgi:hypothetical protein
MSTVYYLAPLILSDKGCFYKEDCMSKTVALITIKKGSQEVTKSLYAAMPIKKETQSKEEK